MGDNTEAYELNPSAKFLLTSLRSVGYTYKTAIADIVDNSISSDASRIDLYFDWDYQRIIIIDDGNGMSEDELLQSMRIGSADPLEIRHSNDLGRFGMGMKTASLSLGKKLHVITKKENSLSNAEWDFTHVDNHNKWEVLIHSENSINLILNSISELEFIDLSEWEQGTIIILSELDRLIDENNLSKSKKKFYQTIEDIRHHLEMIFHRFIEEDDLDIYINKRILNAWNPFVLQNHATQELSAEYLSDGTSDVVIQPFILPHKTKFADEAEFNYAAGVKGWQNQQGFYLYRNRRLIVYGSWFNLIKKEPAYNLARIQIDMSSDSDAEWDIDIKKSNATLPVSIEETVKEIAYLATQRSAEIYNSRGSYTRKKNDNNVSIKYIWEQRKNSAGNYMFYLNKKHPLLMELMQNLDDNMKKIMKTYLSMVENYSPALISGLYSPTKTQEIEESTRQRDILNLKEQIKVFLGAGFSYDEIYDFYSESPEYAYLSNDLISIIEEC